MDVPECHDRFVSAHQPERRTRTIVNTEPDAITTNTNTATVVYVPKPETNGMATAAMILGIAGIPLLFACFMGVMPALAAIILGHIAFHNSKKLNGLGRSQAVTGFVCGYVTFAFLPIVMIIGAVGS